MRIVPIKHMDEVLGEALHPVVEKPARPKRTSRSAGKEKEPVEGTRKGLALREPTGGFCNV